MKTRKGLLSVLFHASVISLAFHSAGEARAKVSLGIDVLKEENFSSLRGMKVGLITNHTGVDGKGKHTIDILHKTSELDLVALFSPEHGIRGKEKGGKSIGHGHDKKTGLPVYSLYGKTMRPTDEMLKGLDALVFDVQDIGTRFYTYITTLAYALEEAAKRGITFVVLDRPNPITGFIVEGEVLDPEISHFTAYLRVPVRHGLTMGEIAILHNDVMGLNADLKVIQMEGWERHMWWDETGLKFLPTSPNIRNLKAATLYPGIGSLEATNVSVGRGTKKPFEHFGAPWIDGKELAESLNFVNLPGLEVKKTKFTPKKDLYRGQVCEGVKFKITNRYEFRPVDLFVHTVDILRDLYPEDFKMRWREIEFVTGSGNLKKMLKTGNSAETILFLMQEKAAKFETDARRYLLYK